MATKSSGLTKAFADLEVALDDFFVKKAPFQLPANIKEIIVTFMPWVTLIFAVLAIPLVLTAFGLTAILSPFATLGGVRTAMSAASGLLSGIPALVALVLEVLSVKGLLARKKSGWNFAYYATFASLLSSLLSYDLFGAVIGAVVSWYILFQVRSYYK